MGAFSSMEEKIEKNETTGSQTTDVSVALVGVSKDYLINKKPFRALNNISIAFPKKGFVAILGPSGCGKTTLLNIIGGLDHVTEGKFTVDGKSVEGFVAKDWDAYRNERIGFVFQSYNLIPHQTVYQNVEAPLLLPGVKRKDREERVKKALEKVGILDEIKKKPNQLSGGQSQRVAIARAIVNEPEIILADEPTGALDSNTSVLVMDLIKELSKDRCVIMVTHNQELAQQYADRVILMKDGEISSDSNPIKTTQNEHINENLRKKRTSMGFLSALRSSGLNILSKKGRTVLTSIACSVGIIGVALVLATTNGFSDYVSKVESSVAASIPISIAPTIYNVNLRQFIAGESYPNDGKIRVYDTDSNLYVYHTNKFTKEYIDYLEALKDPACPAYGTALDVMYNRENFSFNILSEDGMGTGRYRTIPQTSWAGETGWAVNNYTQLPTYSIHEIYGNKDNIGSLYDVIAGRFPESANEMVLFVDQYNRVEYSTLKKLGVFADSSQYIDFADTTIDFSDLLYEGEGDEKYKEYKCYKNSDFYQVASYPAHHYSVDSYENVRFNVSTGKFEGDECVKDMVCYRSPFYGGDTEPYKTVYLDDARFNPITCKIVGVLRPTKESFIQLMPSSLGYLSDLADLLAKDYEEGQPGHEIGEAQKDSWYIPRLYKDELKTQKSDSDGLEVLNRNMTEFMQSLQEGGADVSSYLTSTYITNKLAGAIYYRGVNATYYPSSDGYSVPATTSVSSFLSYCHRFGAEFDTSRVPRMSTSEEDLSRWLTVFLDADFWSEFGDPSIVDCLAYMNSYSLISSILVFPSSLTTKERLKTYLDDYNIGKNEVDQITYADILGDLMNGLSAVISVVSAVLVVFASISLVVSSVMTSIITYVSVVERTKEIGILRACGGRKRDVGRLFEAECVIVGLVAGALGIGATYLLCIPVNLILKSLFPNYIFTNIAALSPWHALALTGIAIVLAFLSGLIPSRIAARKDPVICLRSEG